MLAWFKWIVAEQKAIASLVVLLLGISGVSLYGNVNEFNPWKAAEETVKSPAPVPAGPVKIIETRVEAGITRKEVQAMIDAAINAVNEEYH